ncbi:MAG: YraN family protein [bacterium]|nr:YraN family protein [bacterium]
MEARQKGDYGEEEACNLLVREGYKILERNFHFKHQEIDIIALDKGTLVFIEVRGRKEGLCSPEESIGWWKKKNIIRVAQFYLKKMNLNDFTCRFDVVSILYKNDTVDIKKIELIRDAFQVD